MKIKSNSGWDQILPLNLILRYPATCLFGLVFAFYIYTLAPSVVWADGARLQLDVLLKGSHYWFFEEFNNLSTDGFPFEHQGVSTWDHPLYVMFGQVFLAFPWKEPAFRINLMSALAAAVTISLVYQVGFLLVKDRWAALLGALSLAVSHTFWFHAVTAEVYSLHALFMIMLIWLALRWLHYRRRIELMLFALAAGLGLANSLMFALMLLSLPVFVVSLLASGKITFSISDILSLSGHQPSKRIGKNKAWIFCAMAGLFLLGFAPWWVQFLRAVRVIGLQLTMECTMWFPKLPHMPLSDLWLVGVKNILSYFGWLLYQFTPVGFALGLYGLIRMRCYQPSYISYYLFSIYVIFSVFSSNYPVPDRFAFHLSSYLLFSIFIIQGIAGLSHRCQLKGLLHKNRRIFSFRILLVMIVLSPVFIYPVSLWALRGLGIKESDFGIRPIGTGARDTLEYFLNPNKRGDDSAARFARATLEQLPPDALVFAVKPGDREAYLVLRYFQIAEQFRPDVHLELMLFERQKDVREAVLLQARSLAECRPLYLASLNPDIYPLTRLQAEFNIVPEANIYRLKPHSRISVKMPCSKNTEPKPIIDYQQLIRSALE